MVRLGNYCLVLLPGALVLGAVPIAEPCLDALRRFAVLAKLVMDDIIVCRLPAGITLESLFDEFGHQMSAPFDSSMMSIIRRTSAPGSRLQMR